MFLVIIKKKGRDYSLPVFTIITVGGINSNKRIISELIISDSEYNSSSACSSSTEQELNDTISCSMMICLLSSLLIRDILLLTVFNPSFR